MNRKIFLKSMYRNSSSTNINSGMTKRLKERHGINMGNKYLDGTALTIVIIGAINWLLIGLFRFDLVAFIFGNMSWISRVVYTLVGICGLYLISFYMHLGSRDTAA